MVEEYLPFIVGGLAAGSVFGLGAVGLVLTYKTSGIFNFAHGAVGMVAAYCFYSLREIVGLPTWMAFGIAVVGVATVGGVLLDRVLLRRATGLSHAAYLAISIGLLVALQGLVLATYGPEFREVSPIFPRSTFGVGGVGVGYDQVIVVSLVALMTVGLGALFKFTEIGLRMRAVVENPELVEVQGISSGRVRLFGWILGTGFAAVSGVLLLQFLGLDATALTILALQAFGAAVVGRLVSLPITYAGGVGIGVAAALATKWTAGVTELAGLPPSLPFVVLFLVLVLSRRGRFVEVGGKGGGGVGGTKADVGGKYASPGVAGWCLAGGVVAPLFLSGGEISVATQTLVYVLILGSLGALIGFSGQVSLGHAVFVALGASTFSHLLGAGVPWVIGLVLAGLAVVPLSVILAIPAVRLAGLFLALATFGFGVLADELLYNTPWTFGLQASVRFARPAGLTGDTGYYLLTLGVVALGMGSLWGLYRMRLGRILRALSDSERGLASVGIGGTQGRVIIFGVSAFFAGIAGGLYGGLFRSASSVNFGFTESLLWVAVLMAAGTRTMGGAILGALLLIPPSTLIDWEGFLDWQVVAFGLAVMLLAQERNGLVSLAGRVKESGRRVVRELGIGADWRRARSPVQERERWVMGESEAVADRMWDRAKV